MSDNLTEDQFRKLSALIRRETGIKLLPVKRIMLESRLRKRVRALGLADLKSYARQFIEGEMPAGELVELIDCVTTNKTDFFREPMHFDLLRSRIVPELGARRAGAPFKVWSAASSTGAEAYTTAMVLADIALEQPLPFSILATDISTEVLAQGQRGVYQASMASPIPSLMQRRYLMTSRDTSAKNVRIVPELRAKVRFARLNLMDPTYPVDRDMDVIFCRNVLIYFDQPTQMQVLSKLAGHLRPGGYLLVGHSESMAVTDENGMTQIVPTVYRAPQPRAAAA